MKKLVTWLILAMFTFSISGANATGKTVKIPSNSWVFIELVDKLDDEGNPEVLLLDLPKGGFYSQLDETRILLTVDADDEESELPAFHHYLLRKSKTNLDDLIMKIDEGKKLGVWDSMKSYAQDAGQFLWDKSQSLGDWLDGKYSEWGVYDYVERKGWGDRIRDFFGTN